MEKETGSGGRSDEGDSQVRAEKAAQILEWMKMRLYEKSRSLVLTFGLLELRIHEETKTMGSDGFFLYINADWFLQAFLLDSEALCGLFLHVLCHCMLRHPFLYREGLRRGSLTEFRIAGEIRPEPAELRHRTGIGQQKEGPDLGEQDLEAVWEQEAWELLDEILGDQAGKGRSREQQTGKGRSREQQAGKGRSREQQAGKGRSQDKQAFWEGSRFYGMDDHECWAGRKPDAGEAARAFGEGGQGGGQAGRESWESALCRQESGAVPDNRQKEQRQRWEQALWQAQKEKEGSRQAGNRHLSLVRSITLTREKRCDYRSFLQRFSSLREEGSPDPEQFDYGFYFRGLEEYGNIPLIEPVEYRESRKIEELVLVIDTSGSCSRELVQMFLEETRSILKEEELFFRRFRLHIIQCDNQIQRDDRITSQEELDRYLSQLTVQGGGGTDFRPAFARIEELRREELHRLKGVLYFTDGYGIYPSQMPDYQVAFVFLKHRYDDIDVPDWAEKLVLDAERPRGAGYE